MFSLGMVSTNLFMLFYEGGMQNSNCRSLAVARYFFLQVGEIRNRQRCSSTVPLPVKHRHQRMWRLGFTLIIVGRRTQAQHGKNALLTLIRGIFYFLHITYRTTDRRRTDAVVVCCQNSTTFKPAPPGMRGSLG